MPERANQLRWMNNIMRSSNDEEITMAWLAGGVPDDATDEEFEDFAKDDDTYNTICDCFVRLIQHKGWRY